MQLIGKASSNISIIMSDDNPMNDSARLKLRFSLDFRHGHTKNHQNDGIDEIVKYATMD
jgi:hypothetical protein